MFGFFILQPSHIVMPFTQRVRVEHILLLFTAVWSVECCYSYLLLLLYFLHKLNNYIACADKLIGNI